jgi:hypothetical protein
MNFLKFWKLFFLPTQLGFGGGGGGAPSQSTAYNTNIPEYAKPYVTNMLGATQAQIFNTQKTQTGTTESGEAIYDNQITGFKPYQPYSSNVNDYFAGPSPMQQQSYQGMANMQVAPQLAQGSQFAGAGGTGMLSTTGAAMGYGQQGAGYGQQATGAGQAYQNMATDPSQIQKYMNPYIEQALNPQLAILNQQQALAGQGIAAKATGQGAFGGNRAALSQGLNQQNYALAQQQAVGQGYSDAFKAAQQAQQFGSDLGLRGLQTGIQGAQTGLQGINAAQQGYAGATQAGSVLGQLGQTQYGQQMGILEGQNRFGAQQQGMEQQKINQAISDYATAQQYPMMQLGLMSNMLRGLPMQATTTQSYQATPSIYQQGIGMIGTAAGAKQAGLFKEGGAVKGLAGGGAIKFANTGAVEANPQSSVTRGIQAQLAAMPEEQLRQVATTSPSQEIREMANQIIAQKEIEKQAEMRAEQSMGQQPMQPQMQSQGIAAAPAGSMDTLQAAGGGIIAFANKGVVPDINTLESDEDRLARIQKQQELVGITGKPMEGYGKYIAEQIAKQSEKESQMKGYNLMDISSRFGTVTGGPLYAAQQAVQGSMPEIQKRQETFQSREGQLMKGQAEIENADRLEKAGFIKEANIEREKGLNRIKDLQVANISAKAQLASASRPSDLDKTTTAEFNALVASGANPKDPSTMQRARSIAIEKTGMAGAKLGVNMESKIDAANKQIDAKYATSLLMAENAKEKTAIEAKIKAEKDAVIKRYNEAANLLNADSGGGAPASQAGPVVVDGYQFPDAASAEAYKKAKANKKG